MSTVIDMSSDKVFFTSGQIEPAPGSSRSDIESEPRKKFSMVTGKQLYTAYRGNLTTTRSSNYSHTYHMISFWVDTSICLEAIGFLGPYAAQIGKYEVKLKIFETLSPKLDCQAKAKVLFHGATTSEKLFHVKKQDKFYIKIRPVFLKPDRHYHIMFMLKGPDTVVLCRSGLKRTLDVQIGPIRGRHRDGKIRFEFSQESDKCGQMPELIFSVMSKAEYDVICKNQKLGQEGGRHLKGSCCSIS